MRAAPVQSRSGQHPVGANQVARATPAPEVAPGAPDRAWRFGLLPSGRVAPLRQGGIHYIIGLQKNAALLKRVELAELAIADAYAATGIKQRMIGEFDYAAGTWERS